MTFPVPSILDIALDTAEGRALLASTAAAHGPLLEPAARQLSRLFLIRSPWAPGLRFAGGRIATEPRADGATSAVTFSLSGPAETIEGAVASVVGEGIELVAQVERDGDIVATSGVAQQGIAYDQATLSLLEETAPRMRGGHAEIDWIKGRCTASGEALHVPADWCIRRASGKARVPPPWAMGTGVAAGPTYEHAAIRALLELIERDAVALWWEGGRQGRPIALDDPAAASATALAHSLRQGETSRVSWLLDITTDIGIPCAAAVSCGRDGRAIALGFAARASLAEACRAALLENAQMEIALMIAHARAAGDAGMPPVESDLRCIERGALIDASSCALLHPCGLPARHDSRASADPLVHIVATLAARGLAPILVDLTRADLGLAVVRALAPGLQPAPSSLRTARLKATWDRTGGGHRHTAGVSAF